MSDPIATAAPKVDFGSSASSRQGESAESPAPKIGDRVTIEGTVISFLSGGKEARVRLSNDMPFSPAVISATPESLTVIEGASEPTPAQAKSPIRTMVERFMSMTATRRIVILNDLLGEGSVSWEDDNPVRWPDLLAQVREHVTKLPSLICESCGPIGPDGPHERWCLSAGRITMKNRKPRYVGRHRA